MIARTLQDMFRRYRRPGDVVFALAFLALSVFLISQLGEQTEVTKRTKWYAQPALWPTISLYAMCAFAFLHWLSSAMSPRIAGRWKEVALWLRSLEYVAYFLIYVIAVPVLGYLPSTMIFCVFLAIRTGFRQARCIAIAALFAVVVVIVFRGLLAVKIPAGAIYDHLPETLRSFALIYL
ncbi:tripartite tricarboxylate transporter TctB family protein [Sedimentitalea sp. XS_ASV28]|uniref:tripartite tricarboxylate transporter TctB family protein n=1 Tax=Sedimentitalea sp. XS_ASV28 TaxID=3241296 RepID=UPI0035149581